jgi:error-prone DNA polymerase
MSAKRSHERMERLRRRFYDGMAANGITGDTADIIFDKLLAFANFGFPESHSVSFAYLVYASAWLKLRYPAAFLAALLSSQPMGFWSAQTLVADARRHGVTVLGPDINRSAAGATLEPLAHPPGEQPDHIPTTRSPEPTAHPPGEQPDHIPTTRSPEPTARPGTGVPAEQLAERAAADRALAVRLGLSQVRTIGDDLAGAIAAGAPYPDIETLARRCPLSVAQAEALATAGALRAVEPDRRKALWAAGAAARADADQIAGTVTGTRAPDLEPMTLFDEVGADLWATGVTPAAAPMQFARQRLEQQGVLTAAELAAAEPDRRVLVAGVVTHRQRPATAGGTTFMNLEDETGLINVVCSRGVWARYRTVARGSSALVVAGRLERAEGVVNVIAQRLEALDLRMPSTRSRDFR